MLYIFDNTTDSNDKLRLAFLVADKQCCGSVGVDELRQLMEQLGMRVDWARLPALMDAVSGESGRLNYQRFRALMEIALE